MSSTRVWALSILVLVCGTSPCHSTSNMTDGVQGLLSKDPATRDQTENRIVDEWTCTIGALKQIVSEHILGHGGTDSVDRAIRLLGKLRAAEAVDLLAKYITYPYSPQPSSPASRTVCFDDRLDARPRPIREDCPAVDVLIRIGDPCIPRMIRILSDSDYWDEIEAASTVLLALRSPDEAIILLEKAISDETDVQKQDRLRRAMKQMGLDRSSQ